MKMIYKKTALLTIFALAVTGCTSSLTGDSYSRSGARQSQTILTGTVVDIKDVKIEGTKTGIGTVAGGAAGGVAANSIGQGRGKTLATIAGAGIGMLAGSAIEEGVTRSQGVELVVRLDGSNTVRSYVQQEASKGEFHNGQRVRISVAPNGTARVNPL